MSADPADTGSQSQSLSGTQSTPPTCRSASTSTCARCCRETARTCTSSPATRRASVCSATCRRCASRSSAQDSRARRDARDHAAHGDATASSRRTARTSPTAFPGVSRFRVNVFRHIGGHRRGIPGDPRPRRCRSTSSTCPRRCAASAASNSGLILVTGKTGSGKSTSLAAMIDDINTRIKGHILTIEDPIEFVHPRKNCLISQREVGVHSPGFAEALHSALREDPDVVLVGELRDHETMSIAVTAAEMGILVMGTLHTNGAAATVDRIVNAFPIGQAGPRADHALDLAARRDLAAADPARRQARPRRGARDPDQHAGGVEPDPPGQARPAREHHAERRRCRACGPWIPRSRNCSTRA